MRFTDRSVVCSVAALAAALGYATLRSTGVLAWECTVRYLDPWQHALSCAAIEALPYALVFTIAFFAVYLLARPPEKAP